MTPDVDQYRTRVFRYSLIDGTVEISLGLFALAWAGLMLWSAHRSVDLTWCGVVLGGIGLYSILVYYGTGLIRHRLTYLRTGYVKPRVRSNAFLIPLVVAAILSVVAALLMAQNPSNIRLLVGMAGLFVGAALFYKGWKLKVPRFSILAVVAITAGLVVPFLGLDVAGSGMTLFALVGAAMVVSGVVTLLNYARASQRPENTTL